MLLFVLKHTREFGERVAASLGIEPAACEEREFEDGEHKARPLVDVRGRDCFVIQSLHGGPDASGNDKLARLLFFAGALRDHGAARVTAVVPYLAYARKDRVTKPHDPVLTRYVAQLFEAMGIGGVIAVEVHNVAAFQNAFRIPTLHVEAAEVLAARAGELAGTAPVVVASPDPGGVKRAQLFRETLEALLARPVGAAYLEKRRSAGVVSGELLAGEVRGATVLLFDDLISTGGTMLRAARTCLAAGAARVYALAAHGLFNAGAGDMIADPAIAATIVTDTVPTLWLGEAARARIEIVSAAPAVAAAVRRLHAGALAHQGAAQA